MLMKRQFSVQGPEKGQITGYKLIKKITLVGGGASLYRKEKYQVWQVKVTLTIVVSITKLFAHSSHNFS